MCKLSMGGGIISVKLLGKCWYNRKGHGLGILRPGSIPKQWFNVPQVSRTSFQGKGINQDDLVSTGIFKSFFLLQNSWLFSNWTSLIPRSMGIFSWVCEFPMKNINFVFSFWWEKKRSKFSIIWMMNTCLQILAHTFIFYLWVYI